MINKTIFSAAVLCFLLKADYAYGQWVSTNGPWPTAGRMYSFAVLDNYLFTGSYNYSIYGDGGLSFSSDNGTSWSSPLFLYKDVKA